MNREQLLSRIAICLVEPTYAGNIGSVSRAMKNMGLSRLILVGGTDPDCNETRQMASGHYDIIENAVHADSVQEAILPYQIVAGTSRRTGKSRRPTHQVNTYPDILFPQLEHNEAVILFGREKHGLSTEELDLCHHRILIPTNGRDGSLNLAQAVLITAYELWMAAEAPVLFTERKLATNEDLEQMYGHMQGLFVEAGFIDKENPQVIMRAFRKILGRNGLTSRDTRILHGVFSDLEWYIDHCVEVGKRDGPRKDSSDGTS